MCVCGVGKLSLCSESSFPRVPRGGISWVLSSGIGFWWCEQLYSLLGRKWLDPESGWWPATSGWAQYWSQPCLVSPSTTWTRGLSAPLSHHVVWSVDLWKGKRDLDRLDQWGKAIAWGSAKGRARSCTWLTNSPRWCYRLGDEWLQSCPAEKDLRAGLQQLNMSQSVPRQPVHTHIQNASLASISKLRTKGREEPFQSVQD